MPKSQKSSRKLPQQLLVEGDNDRHVIWALCAQHQLPEVFSVEILSKTVLQEIQQISYTNRYIEAHRPKALIHTWLAWQKKPGMPMGQAITAKALKHDSAIALTFIAWLRHLFQIPHN